MDGGPPPIRVLAVPAQVAARAAAWNRLADAHGVLPTQAFAWADAALRAFGNDGRATVVVAGDEAGLSGVAPLVLRRGHLEILGLAELFEPADLLAGSPGDLRALCAALVGLHLPLRLERLPADSPTPAALRFALGHRGRVVVRDAPGWPALTLDSAWTELGGGLSSRRRSDLRRAMRRAEAVGPVSIRLLAPDVAEVPALLEEAFAIEARSWKGAEGTALAHDRRRAEFFRRYAEDAAARGHLRVAFLDVGEQAAAMQIGVEWQRRSWLLKIGYDDALARCSPGMLLLAHTVRDAAERGLEAYELLGTADDWARPWTTVVRPAISVVAYPAHPRALPGTARDAAALAGRRGRRVARQAARSSKALAIRHAERRYLAGPALEDALRVEAGHADRGLLTTVGYWNAETDPVDLVLGEYRAQIAALTGRAGGQISIKAPAIGDDLRAVAGLLAAAADSGTGIHLDSLAPATQPAALDIACHLAGTAPGRLGCTLPGRWPRSVADAARVAAAGLRVRVVKSEWPSAEDPGHDPRHGYLDVVEALAGAGAPHVGVATHDAPLARHSLAKLSAAGIPCELQVLHGMRARAAIEEARTAGVAVRVYVPYGHGRLPYSVDEAMNDPRVAARLARDLVRRNRAL